MIRMIGLMLCVVAVAMVGCDSGPPLGKVSGTVTMDGEPVENALVTFTPVEGGRSSSGTTDEQGKYTLGFIDGPGALVGEHQVTVKSLPKAQQIDEELKNMSSDDPRYQEMMAAGAQAYNNAQTEETIPEKYNTNTTLQYEVTKGQNTIDLELTSE